ncbi:MAG TPA: hypothetical protein VFJ51_06565 [Nitrososphaeraceae archaeon]|nr:hypothetical protein [Nitrososphaeraceae archaeon]
MIAVRKALANIPVYMICDDHEITYDWYITLNWCNRVLSKLLGKRVILNGLLAFAVFQAWGNTHDSFKNSNAGEELLKAASNWRGNMDGYESTISKCLGMLELSDINDKKKLSHPTGSLNWHYVVDGPKYQSQSADGNSITRLLYRVIVLDTRTWRSYPRNDKDGLDPPALLSEEAFDKQIPKLDITIDGVDIMLVLVATPVEGVPLVEDIQGFLATFFRSKKKKSKAMEKYDYEAWGNQH